jgi:hypothetical protein
MPINIKSTKDIAKDHHVKCLVYGFAGVEKTRSLASAPRPLIISAEHGLLSLSDKDVDCIEITKAEEIDEIYRNLLGEWKDKYDTVCLDSLSDVAEVLINHIAKTSGNKDGRKNYGMLADAMLPMIRKFRDLDMNVIFICKCKIVHDEDTGTITWNLMMPGGVLPAQIPYMFDEVFCQQKNKDGTVFLQTVGDSTRACKDRSGKLSKNERPDYAAIFNKIKT